MRAHLSRSTLIGALAAVGVLACSDDDVTSEDTVCPDGQTLSTLEVLQTKRGFDFVGLVSYRNAFATTVGDLCESATDRAMCENQFTATAGVLCRSATDRATCETRAKNAPGDNTGLQDGRVMGVGYYVATRGDEVIVADSPAELRALVGPVDDPRLALLLVRPDAPTFDCRSTRVGVGSDQSTVVKLTQPTCGGARREFYLVSQSGDVKRTKTEEDSNGGCVVEGRLHEAQPLVAFEGRDVASYLARGVYFEAGSVDSFNRLARELEAHGAPASLVDRARGAAHDEVEHAELLSSLARTHGAASLVLPPTGPTHLRSLEEIALENAIEGGVREAFAALIALYQAACAKDPTAKRVMQRIATDEARHAELAWDVERWIDAHLTADARERVASLRTVALEELEGVEHQVDDDAKALLGLPDRATTGALAKELAKRLG